MEILCKNVTQHALDLCMISVLEIVVRDCGFQLNDQDSQLFAILTFTIKSQTSSFKRSESQWINYF